MPELLAQGTVYAGTPGAADGSCCWPGIAVLPGGRWICGFRAAPSKNGTDDQKVFLAWSDDEGQHWTPPVQPFIPPEVHGRPGYFRGAYLTALGEDRVLVGLYWVDHSHPERPFFNEETEGLLDSRIFLAYSDDGGASWSEPQMMDTAPYHIPTPITGPVLRLANGELACQLETNKHYDDREPWWHAAMLFFSRDGGRSWPEHVVIANDPSRRFFYWDQRPNVLADGSLLDLFWTYDNERAAYLNIHARASHDHGRSWSPLWDIGVPGQPAQPISLSDGRLAMVYVDRTGAPIIKMRVSADGGQSWPAETEMILAEAEVAKQTEERSRMQDAWSEMGKFSLGLPNAVLLPNDEVLVAYYSGPSTDHTAIRWLRVRP